MEAGDLSPLGPVLADPHTIKVLHAADLAASTVEAGVDQVRPPSKETLSNMPKLWTAPAWLIKPKLEKVRPAWLPPNAASWAGIGSDPCSAIQ